MAFLLGHCTKYIASCLVLYLPSDGPFIQEINLLKLSLNFIMIEEKFGHLLLLLASAGTQRVKRVSTNVRRKRLKQVLKHTFKKELERVKRGNLVSTYLRRKGLTTCTACIAKISTKTRGEDQ